MSRGSYGNEHVDPDLTPMLDVVMQLLMYFILCVNFVSEEVSSDILLPDGQTARPLIKGNDDVLLLNIREDGSVKVYGLDAMDIAKTKDWLLKRYAEAESRSSDKQVHTTIIVRAHNRTNYESIFQVLRICKDTGFRRFNLRANMRGTA
ncbi:MAG: ExbD/TolR family protein [Gemmataceae bacterium]